jgi:hypothetical protein
VQVGLALFCVDGSFRIVWSTGNAGDLRLSTALLRINP